MIALVLLEGVGGGGGGGGRRGRGGGGGGGRDRGATKNHILELVGAISNILFSNAHMVDTF